MSEDRLIEELTKELKAAQQRVTEILIKLNELQNEQKL